MSALEDVLQARDPGRGEPVHRVPGTGTLTLAFGAVCAVGEDQVAVFAQDGQIRDVLGPGRHVLSTATLPLVSAALGLTYGSKDPFEAAVFFVSQRVFTGWTWRTPRPVVFRDRDLGAVPLSAYGRYTVRIGDPVSFLNGSPAEALTVDAIQAEHRTLVASRLQGLLDRQLGSLRDLECVLNELATEARLELKDAFRRQGIDLIDFFITSIVPAGPDAPRNGSASAAGVTLAPDAETPADAYLQYRAGQAPCRSDPAGSRPNGSGRGSGIGIGGGMGFVLPPAAAGKVERGAPRSPASHAGCPACARTVPPGARYCPHCGSPQRP